jgi:hypothetical protein
MIMNKFILAAAFVAFTGATANAAALSDKVQMDHPGVRGAGVTTSPLSKPESGGLADRAMRILPGNTGEGRTLNPTARPDQNSLSSKVARDLIRG